MNILYLVFETPPENLVVHLIDVKNKVFKTFFDPTLESIRDFLVPYSVANKNNIHLLFPNLNKILRANHSMLLDRRLLDFYGKFGADVDGDLMTIGDIIRIGG